MLPVLPVQFPPELNENMNGRLSAAQLGLVVMGNGGRAQVLKRVVPALDRLVSDAAKTGFLLALTSDGDDYRSLQAQDDLFHRRYRPGVGPGGLIPPTGCQFKTKSYQGKLWWLLKGAATAAVPGTSNHGFGLAVDLGVWTGARVQGITGPALDWLVANAWRYGFSFELQSEPWHIRYVAGDKIPPALQAPVPPAGKVDDVYGFVRKQGKTAVYLGNFITKRWMKTPEQYAAQRAALIFNGVPAVQLEEHLVDSDAALAVWGETVGADPGDV